jgi:hypothetical protein
MAMDKRVVEYCTVCGQDGDKPTQWIVSEVLENGWQPWGSPYFDKKGYEHQAMVKYEGWQNWAVSDED